jgi:hypothetical protein
VPTSPTTDATCHSSGLAPVSSTAEPPPLPRALSGAPLLLEIPQSSYPPHRVALAAIPEPPRRRPTPESGRPATATLLRTPLPPLPPRGLHQRRYWAAPSAVPTGREPAAHTGRPGKAVGRVRSANRPRRHCGRGPRWYCATGPWRIQPSDSRFIFFSIFRIYSNPCKFKKIVYDSFELRKL